VSTILEPQNADSRVDTHPSHGPSCHADLSLREVRGLVLDLFRPNPWIYWTDLLLSWSVGIACLGLGQYVGFTSPWFVLFYLGSVLTLYRAVLFIHELTHLRAGTFLPFRAAWNLLVGVPFLMPSFLYHTHVAHHMRKHYGTAHDGEYLPLGRKGVWPIIGYLAQSFVIPALAPIRFLLLSPLAWISPRLRTLIGERASSMVIDPSYVRPLPTHNEMRIWRLQEAGCFLCAAAAAVLLFAGWLPLTGLLQVYMIAVGIILLNAIRTLGAHRYLHTGEELTFTDQLLDSVNYPNRPLLTELWAPVGLRFHALHHLLPSMPYHSLPEAHRRLMAGLPANSPYRRTSSESLGSSIAELWRNARRSRGEVHQHRPHSTAA
jgi:hypothetical protein